MSVAFAYVANTNTLKITGLKSTLDNAFMNDAVVTVTVKNGSHADSPDLSGASWPLTMVYVAASDGDYAVGLTHTLPFLNGKHYLAIIDAFAPVDPERFAHWEFPFKGVTRSGSNG